MEEKKSVLLEKDTEVISQADAGRMLGMTSEGVRYLILRKHLESVKVGRSSLVKMESLNKLISDRKKLKPDGRRKA